MQKIRIRATPGSAKNQVIGWREFPQVGRVLCLKIAAPATEGKANAALRNYLAELLNLPPSCLSLEKGDKSRIKTFLLPASTIFPEFLTSET